MPLCLLLGSGVALALPAAASASESIYWTSNESIEQGTVGSTTDVPAAKVLYEKLGSTAAGLALDPAASTLFWSEPGPGDILSGAIAPATPATSGTSLVTGDATADGVGLNAGAKTPALYWSVPANEEILTASLTGSGPTAVVTGAEEAAGIAIDPTTNKVYWANLNGEILAAPLSGTPTIETLYEGLNAPEGVAVDASNQTIYWTEYGAEAIVGAPLAGKGTKQTLYTNQESASAIAVDPGTNDLYWGAEGEVVVGSTAGEATVKAAKLYTSDGASAGIALLDPPVSAAKPTITGTAAIGSTLTCAATWDADLPESQLYRAPVSASTTYKWFHDGTEIKEQTKSTLALKEGGEITCEAIATNAAGSTTSEKSAVTAVPVPAPTVSISAPTSAETTFYLNETVATKFSCKEGAGGTGIASCVDSNGTKGTASSTTSPITSESGAGSLQTGSLGAHTYTATVTAKDGQTATATFSYTIEPNPIVSFPEVTIVSLGKAVKAGKLSAKIACEPGEPCAGKLKLTTTAKAASTKTTSGKKAKGKAAASKSKGKAKSKKLTLATGSYKLAAGKGETVQLKLSSSVLKKLEQAKKRTISVTLEATVTNGTPATLTAKVTIPAAKASKAKGKGKTSKGGKSSKK